MTFTSVLYTVCGDKTKQNRSWQRPRTSGEFTINSPTHQLSGFIPRNKKNGGEIVLVFGIVRNTLQCGLVMTTFTCNLTFRFP